MIKLVITDVDGTIVKEGTKDINPEYFDVVRKLLAKGIKVVFASGRQYQSICSVIEPIKDLVWFIAESGATLKMDDGLKALNEIPREWVTNMYRDISNIPGMDCMLCSPEYAYVPFDTTELYHRLIHEYHFNTAVLGGWDKLPKEPIAKISLYRPTEIFRYTDQYFVPRWEDKIHMSIAGECWLDCCMPGINKGTALQRIMDHMGITADEVLATGDNPNDLEMIKLAGRGLAVSNAHPSVIEAADGVIPGFAEDGVLQEWKKLL